MPIRLRLAALFALGTALVVVVGSVVFVHFLAAGLRSSVDSGLRARADVIATTLDSLAAASAVVPVATVQGQGEGIAQVFDSTGRMVGSSSGAGDAPLLSAAQLIRARSGPVRLSTTLNSSGDSSRAGEHTRLLALPVDRPGGPWVIVVGASLEVNDTALQRVTRAAVLAGFPAVLVGAAGAWLLASAALRPVERMRRQVAEISEHDRDTAIGVPGTRDEIAALARTMNGLLGRLQAALARERGFVADAGHELRTPLAILRTELELASRPGRSQVELVGAVAAAAEETDRLARLAEDLLLLARTDGRDTLRTEPTDLYRLCAAAVERARALGQVRDVELALDAPQPLECELDPDRVRQAVDNLIDNALRHAPPGSVVTVRARYAAGEARIEVIDDGPGFPPEFLPHAFERFRRADAARARQHGGAGLGLAIVQSIAQAHGGRATAANRPEGGAVVRIELSTAQPGAPRP